MERKLVVALLIGVIIGAIVVVSMTIAFPSNSIGIEKGSFAVTASYLVWEKDSMFYRKDGFTGEVSSGINDTVLIQYGIDQATANGGSVFVKAGNYNATLTLKDNVTLILDKGAVNITVLVDTDATCKLEDYERGIEEHYVNGTINMAIDYANARVYYVPLIHFVHFSMSAGVTDIVVHLLPAGCFPNNMHITEMTFSVDVAPGGASTLNASLTDGTTTMFVELSGSQTSCCSVGNEFDFDANSENLTLTYSQSAGGSASKGTIAILNHNIP